MLISLAVLMFKIAPVPAAWDEFDVSPLVVFILVFAFRLLGPLELSGIF